MSKEDQGWVRVKKGGSNFIEQVINLADGSDKPVPTGEGLQELLRYVQNVGRSDVHLFPNKSHRDKPPRVR